MEAYWPISSSRFQRWARAIALIIVLSMRARGGLQGVPSGAMTSFRPPRFLIAKGTRTVNVPKDETHASKAKYERKVDKDYTLTIKGNWTINVDGNITIKSKKSVSVESQMAFDLKSGKDLTIKADITMTR